MLIISKNNWLEIAICGRSIDLRCICNRIHRVFTQQITNKSPLFIMSYLVKPEQIIWVDFKRPTPNGSINFNWIVDFWSRLLKSTIQTSTSLRDQTDGIDSARFHQHFNVLLKAAINFDGDDVTLGCSQPNWLRRLAVRAPIDRTQRKSIAIDSS